MIYSNLDKEQLVKLEKRLKEWQETIETIANFDQNKPRFEIRFVENRSKQTLSLASIDSKRPPSQFGSQKQRAHTVAYSAVTRSIIHLFQNFDVTQLKQILREFHRELHMTYAISVTADPIKFNGRKAVFGKLNLHDLKELADKAVTEIFAQEEGDLFTTIPVILKLYLTTFLYMNNRLVDATVDQVSKGRGEGAALDSLEKLGNSLIKNECIDKSDALRYMSKLIDEEAVRTALNSPGRECKSFIAFQILGVYRLMAAFPKLIKLLSFDKLFLRNVNNDQNVMTCLAHIIFHKSDQVNPRVIYQPTQEEIQLLQDSLALLQAAYRIANPYGASYRVHH